MNVDKLTRAVLRMEGRHVPRLEACALHAVLSVSPPTPTGAADVPLHVQAGNTRVTRKMIPQPLCFEWSCLKALSVWRAILLPAQALRRRHILTHRQHPCMPLRLRTSRIPCPGAPYALSAGSHVCTAYSSSSSASSQMGHECTRLLA